MPDSKRARRTAALSSGDPSGSPQAAAAAAPPVHSYVRKAVLDSLRQKLKTGGRVDGSEMASLKDVEGAPDEEILVPVDLARLMDQDTETYRRMAADPTFSARSYVDAAELFDSNPEGAPLADRPAPMSARDWREQALASASEDSDEGGGSEEGEEEEPGEGDEEEDDPAGEDGAESAGGDEAAEGAAAPAGAAAAAGGAQVPPPKKPRRA